MIAEIVVWIANIAKLLGMAIFVFKILPKMWEESKVPNGLGFLRKSIFVITIVYVYMNLVSFIPLLTNPQEIKVITQLIIHNYFFIFINMTNGFGVLTISIILYLIYHYDYGEEVGEKN